MLFRRKRKEDKKSGILFCERPEKSELELTTDNIKDLIKHSSDIVFHEIYINGRKDLPATMIFVDGIINMKIVDENILKPLIQDMKLGQSGKMEDVIGKIEHGTVYHALIKTRDKLEDCISDIIDGSVAFVFDQARKAIAFDVKGFEKRSIAEPTSENVIKGSKDAFVEDLRTNTATIRRKIKTHNLIIEETRAGKQTLTKIAVVYIKGITNWNIVDELKKRLDKISIDGVLSAGIIEENIIDNKYTPFPQITYTERPDKFCASIIEGRVGVVIDGLPLAYVAPCTIEAFLQAPEDYSQNFIISSIIRFLRFILVSITLLLPGIYVSVTTFHHEMLPTELALAITASKEGVPFPAFIEVILMLVAFEILIEAGIRLPRAIGQAVSIVGAIVVGQAAVAARLVSPAVVVVIAFTAISSFAMPNQDFSNALRLWRFIFVILSSIIGLFGLSLGGIILLNNLSGMEVFGVPYMSPFVGEDNKNMSDSLFRLPFSADYKRPMSLKTLNKKRQGQGDD